MLKMKSNGFNAVLEVVDPNRLYKFRFELTTIDGAVLGDPFFYDEVGRKHWLYAINERETNRITFITPDRFLLTNGLSQSLHCVMVSCTASSINS